MVEDERRREIYVVYVYVKTSSRCTTLQVALVFHKTLKIYYNLTLFILSYFLLLTSAVGAVEVR